MGTTAPLAPASLTAMRSVLPQYGVFSFDLTLAAAREALGPNPDPASSDQARRLRVWLNQWTCRIGYPSDGRDVFVESLSARTGGGSDQQAFLRHLTLCRTWAVALEQEASQRGIGPEEIGRALGRPASSVAKLIDEWLWAAISGSFSGDGSR